MTLAGNVKGFAAITGFAHHLVAVFIRQDLAQPVACRSFVIDDQDFHDTTSSKGKRRVTVIAVIAARRY